jgi:hypothetical protein
MREFKNRVPLAAQDYRAARRHITHAAHIGPRLSDAVGGGRTV